MAEPNAHAKGSEVQEGQPRGKKRRWLMRAIYLLAGLLGLLVVVVVLMPVISPFFRRLVEARIKALTGRETTVEGLSINLLSTRASVGRVVLKEKDGSADFMRVEQVEADFQLWPLLKNAVRLPQVTVGDFKARVRVDESGQANYQDILDRMGEGKKPTEAEPGFREIRANMRVENAEIDYENRQTGVKAALKDVALESQVKGMENISYSASDAAVAFEDAMRDVQGSCVCNITGKASMAGGADGNGLGAKGTVTLSQIELRREAGPVLHKQSVELTHDLSMQSGGKLSIVDVTLDSEMLSAEISDVQLPDAAQLTSLLTSAMQATNAAEFKKAFGQVSFEGWTGNIVVQTDLGQVRQVMGDGLDALAGKKVSDFGGAIRLSAELHGSSASTLEIQQGLRATDVSVEGQMKRQDGEWESYSVRLASLSQDLTSTLNTEEAKFSGSNKILLTVPGGGEKPTEVIDGQQKWNIAWHTGGEATGLHIGTAEHELTADLTALGKLAKSFLPQGTVVEGKLEARDRVWSASEGGYAEEGNSDLAMRLTSSALERPLPLHVTSERQLRFQTDPLRVTVQKLDVHSQGSDLIHADVTGEFGVSLSKPANLTVDLNSDLAELEPFLKALGQDIALAGKLKQTLEVASSPGKTRITGAGGLQGFSYQPAAGKGQAFELNSVAWDEDATVYLEDGFPRRAELGETSGGEIGVRIPGIAAQVSGMVEEISPEAPFCRLNNVTVTTRGDLAKLPIRLQDRLAQWGVRPGKTVPLTADVRVDGPADALTLRNSLQLSGDIEVGATADKGGFVWDRPLSSTLHLSVKGIPAYAEDADANPMKVDITTPDGSPPLLRVGGQNAPLAEIRVEGGAFVSGAGLTTESLKMQGHVNGEELLSVVPGQYFKGTGLTPEQFKVGGRCELSGGLQGSYPDSLKSTATMDMQKLSIDWTGKNGKVLLVKNTDVPMSLSAEADVIGGSSGIRLQVDPLRLRCADLQGTGTAAVGPGMKVAGLGDAKGAELSVKAEKFETLRKMLPWLQDLELDEPTFSFEVIGISYPGARGGLEADTRARLGLTSMSLPRLAVVLAEQMGLGKPTEKEKAAAKPAEPAAPISLSPEFREKLKGVSADAQIHVKKVDMGHDNRLENFNLALGLNQQERNNRLNLTAGAAVNPHKERKGQFEFSSTGRLDKRSPHFSADYNIADLPVPEEVFELVKRQTASRYPLVEAMRFASPSGLYMGMQGSSEWQGVRWAAMTHSLTSDQPLTISLPPGEFNLEVSLDRILGSDTVQNLLSGRLEGLRNTLEQAKGQKQQILSRLQQVQGTLDTLQKAIQKIENQREKVNQTIEQLKPLAAFSDSTQEKLEELQGKVDEYYSELEKKKEQATEKRETTSRLQEELNKTREKLEGLRNKVEEARESALGLKQVFDFSFDGMQVDLSIQNDSPWPGLEASEDLLQYATSRLHLNKVSFTPEKKDFPQFSGWLDLAGPYRIHIMPPEGVMAKIEEKAPPVATALRRSGGLVITPEGVRPVNISPFSPSGE